jgi:hypothetical protein
VRQLQERYAALVQQDSGNAVFGPPDQYFRAFARSELEALAKREPVLGIADDDAGPGTVRSLEDWAVAFARSTDLSCLQYPVIALREYLMDPAAATASLESQIGACNASGRGGSISVQLGTRVTALEPADPKGSGLVVSFQHTVAGNAHSHKRRFCHVLNATGEAAGILDDAAGVAVQRFRELKQVRDAMLPHNRCAW